MNDSREQVARGTLASCSKCGAPHERDGQRLCAGCHAEQMREWRARQRGRKTLTRIADMCEGEANRAEAIDLRLDWRLRARALRWAAGQSDEQLDRLLDRYEHRRD